MGIVESSSKWTFIYMEVFGLLHALQCNFALKKKVRNKVHNTLISLQTWEETCQFKLLLMSLTYLHTNTKQHTYSAHGGHFVLILLQWLQCSLALAAAATNFNLLHHGNNITRRVWVFMRVHVGEKVSVWKLCRFIWFISAAVYIIRQPLDWSVITSVLCSVCSACV